MTNRITSKCAVWSVVGILLLISIVAICNRKPECNSCEVVSKIPIESTSTIQWVKYTDVVNKVTFEYPLGWEIYNSTDEMGFNLIGICPNDNEDITIATKSNNCISLKRRDLDNPDQRDRSYITSLKEQGLEDYKLQRRDYSFQQIMFFYGYERSSDSYLMTLRGESKMDSSLVTVFVDWCNPARTSDCLSLLKHILDSMVIR